MKHCGHGKRTGKGLLLADLLGPSLCTSLKSQEELGNVSPVRMATVGVCSLLAAAACISTSPRNGYPFCLTFGKKKPGNFPQRHPQRTKEQLSKCSTYLGLRVQVGGISGDAELHRPCFYGNYSYRYSSQPGNVRDKSKFRFPLLDN